MFHVRVSAICLLLLPAPVLAHVDVTQFAGDAFTAPAEVVDCALETGDAAQCLSVTLAEKPENLTIGPFCPDTLDDIGGVWHWSGTDEGLYRLDGAFWEKLIELGFDFTDGEGNINFGSPNGAMPEADHACISATITEDVTITALIPLEPIMAVTPSQLGTVNKVGIALDGVPIFSDAPTVEATGHLPALDTCGGHVDPGGWFHWHGTATDMNTVYEAQGGAADCTSKVQSTTAQFASAFDGFPIFGSQEVDGSVVTGLDACNGHDDADIGYHYHATSDFPNLPACLVGVTAQHNFATTAQAGIGAMNGTYGPGGPGRPGGQGEPDLAAAAEQLGISEQALEAAFSDAGGPPADFEAIAALLDISVEALRAALPPPPNR